MLDQPAADARGRAVQWRQLVELLARGETLDPHLREQALGQIALAMDELEQATMAATARAIAGRAVPAELVALFAARGAAVSAAMIMAADLDPAGWAAVRAVAAPDVLPLLATLGRGLVDDANGASVPPIVAAATAVAPSEPLRLPDEQTAGLFRWECGPTGDIDWVEGVPRAALVGRNLAEEAGDHFAARLPFGDQPLVLAEDGALGGEWRWSGTPAFFSDSGRFAGYRGVARREGGPERIADTTLALPEDGDLRELMHELRTPLNAIIGFGEIIEGQYLGPAHRAYRARASEIVRQARRLAEAVDFLDLAAKLRSNRFEGERRTVVAALRREIERVAASGNGASLRIEDRAGEAVVALPPVLAERLSQLFVGALITAADSAERMTLVIDRIGKQLALALDRPAGLADFDEASLLDPSVAGGARFDLRMAQGLAEMTGGRLDVAADRLVLLLPLA